MRPPIVVSSLIKKMARARYTCGKHVRWDCELKLNIQRLPFSSACHSPAPNIFQLLSFSRYFCPFLLQPFLFSSPFPSMALEDDAAADPSQIPVVAAAAVALEARRSAAAMRKRRNEADLASTLVHVQ
jgi:hypothetical protein